MRSTEASGSSFDRGSLVSFDWNSDLVISPLEFSLFVCFTCFLSRPTSLSLIIGIFLAALPTYHRGPDFPPLIKKCTGGSEFGDNIRLRGHSRIDIFVVFPSEIRQMAGNQAWYGAKNSNPASVPCHYAPVGPWRWFRSTGKNTKSGAKFGPKNVCSARP